MRFSALFLVVLVLGYTSAALTHEDYNVKYEPMMYGQNQLTGDIAYEMYIDFLQTYKEVSPNDAQDHMERFSIFRDNLEEVIRHNNMPGRTFDKGINQFSDMTKEEFFDHFNLDVTAGQDCSATSSPSVAFEKQSPASFDWRIFNAVTPVKSQGKCGSCWTFSTVGAMESHFNISYGKALDLSEQQLVDCAGDFDNHGCSGGLPSHAFSYIQYYGLTDRSHYAYTAKDDNCTYDQKEMEIVYTTGPYNITEKDEGEMQEHLFNRGPISCAFQVYEDFRDYKNGTYSSNGCKNGAQDINHAVLCVGYGHDKDANMDFWSVKNSWGAQWGDSGYFNIQKGVNMCGIGVCNSYPAKVRAYPHQDIASYLRAYK